MSAPRVDPDGVVAATREWIERAVIGLNLCPFAKAVYIKDQIRYAVSSAQDPTALLSDLERELRVLSGTEPAVVDTTLLIHPDVLGAFPDYNDFITLADRAIGALGLAGVFQIATFHPAYQFSGTATGDITNYTNRSPYPMLQILREASMSKAVQSFPDAHDIYQRNIETLRRLGAAGLDALGLTPRSGNS